jgi:hypothetical protein
MGMPIHIDPAWDRAPVVLTPEMLKAANINPNSFLATDYLNHFNEFLMLYELIPAMPDMLPEVMGWAPKSYSDHFLDTGFVAKDLAIAAYAQAPVAVRVLFDEAVDAVNAAILNAQELISAIPADDSLQAQMIVDHVLEVVRPLLARADSLIHGRTQDLDAPQTQSSQSDIDALFD